MYVELVLNRHA